MEPVFFGLPDCEGAPLEWAVGQWTMDAVGSFVVPEDRAIDFARNWFFYRHDWSADAAIIADTNLEVVFFEKPQVPQGSIRDSLESAEGFCVRASEGDYWDRVLDFCVTGRSGPYHTWTEADCRSLVLSRVDEKSSCPGQTSNQAWLGALVCLMLGLFLIFIYAAGRRRQGSIQGKRDAFARAPGTRVRW